MRFKRLSISVNEVEMCLHLEKDFTTAASKFNSGILAFFFLITSTCKRGAYNMFVWFR